MKGAKFSPQNRSWNFISWSLQKPDCIYLIPCFIFIHIYLSCFIFQSRRHSALCQADLGGMFCQGVLAVLWCTHHHSLLLNRHWGLTAHLGFLVCLGFFFTNRFSRILRPILKKGPIFLKKKCNEKNEKIERWSGSFALQIWFGKRGKISCWEMTPQIYKLIGLGRDSPSSSPKHVFLRAKAVRDYLAPQIKASFHSITKQFPGPHQKREFIFSDQVMLQL